MINKFGNELFFTILSITINNKNILIDRGYTVLQACELLNIEVPRFCFHKELSVAGNCRMCLVEIERFPKPVASCAMPLSDNMVIFTDSPLVRKARESVLEFILVNHPLDCPICDQGGECDLQDQTFKYGSDSSRFFLKHKRSVEDKNFGPIVKTVMTRCIHCTRCVRFADEIAGIDFLGTSGRGSKVEIGCYIEKTLSSELSGNVIDLCPVGALTSKPYAFQARPWELTTYNTIDLNDALGAHIQVDVVNNKIMRVKPDTFVPINDSWISDKARFSFDGLSFLENDSNTKNVENFISLFLVTQVLISKGHLRFVSGAFADLETLSAFQDYAYTLGANHVESISVNQLCIDFEKNYKFSKFTEIENSDVLLVISNNLRHEAPNLNIKVKVQHSQNNLQVGYIGSYYENTFGMEHLGISTSVLTRIAEGKHPFSRLLKKSKQPKIILGSKNNLFVDLSTLTPILEVIGAQLGKKTLNQIVNILSFDAGAVNAMDLGLVSLKNKKLNSDSNFLHLLHFDKHFDFFEKEFSNYSILNQGLNFKTFQNNASFFCPVPNHFEEEKIFINLEGRVQKTVKAVSSPMSENLSYNGVNLLNTLTQFLNGGLSIESKKDLLKKLPFLKNNTFGGNFNFSVAQKQTKIVFLSKKLDYFVKNFYKTNLISKFSVTMNQVSRKYRNIKNFK